jgi:hypothetical protein
LRSNGFVENIIEIKTEGKVSRGRPRDSQQLNATNKGESTLQELPGSKPTSFR